jgi:hypothetical protein
MEGQRSTIASGSRMVQCLAYAEGLDDDRDQPKAFTERPASQSSFSDVLNRLFIS